MKQNFIKKITNYWNIIKKNINKNFKKKDNKQYINERKKNIFIAFLMVFCIVLIYKIYIAHDKIKSLEKKIKSLEKIIQYLADRHSTMVNTARIKQEMQHEIRSVLFDAFTKTLKMSSQNP